MCLARSNCASMLYVSQVPPRSAEMLRVALCGRGRAVGFTLEVVVERGPNEGRADVLRQTGTDPCADATHQTFKVLLLDAFAV